MLGRHNITIYADELERCIGGIRQMLAQGTDGMTYEEECYWMGALFTLERLLSTSLPDDWKAFIAAMKMHFTGEMPGNLIDESKENQDA